ncbi:MAG TPA: response regulator transcription factor [Solirubrobacteraceae bacterium]|jgi:DNA-binding NarL/FixJ family response regulator|nr:response regulator transcription factor [Solirubrobacteraceae bacterium]
MSITAWMLLGAFQDFEASSSGSTGSIRVLLCDDVPEFRALLRLALEDDPGLVVVGETGDGRACVDCVLAQRPDVLLLDLSMPDFDGLEALPQIRAQAPDTAVVVLSGFSASRMAEQVLAAGAAGYLEKGTSFEGIRAAVRAAAEGHR